MTATGTFEVDLSPQEDEAAPAGRMLIDKTYQGDLVGKGIGQMISKRTDNGVAVYFAIEEFEGTLQGKSGTFTLLHNGKMSAEVQSLDIAILEGSASGELTGLTGAMRITQQDGKHSYELDFEL
ncbi:MAG: hypothetical protein CL579_14195 [Alteromonadaceae bacterium]|jgi:hypothetical protein|nr:hypothetical protein [Alteromonadaceae bacterium]MBB18249.1 hypothetical protein [Rickettsiales bacterium]